MFGPCSKKVDMLRKFLDRIMCNLMICLQGNAMEVASSEDSYA